MLGFRQAKKKRVLRIYFVSDLHGSEVCFRKFLAAAKVYEPDVLILGGDFAGKGLVPVLRHGDSWSATVPLLALNTICPPYPPCCGNVLFSRLRPVAESLPEIV